MMKKMIAVIATLAVPTMAHAQYYGPSIPGPGAVPQYVPQTSAAVSNENAWRQQDELRQLEQRQAEMEREQQAEFNAEHQREYDRRMDAEDVQRFRNAPGGYSRHFPN